MILSGNILYGTAGYGGSSGSGTVFKVNTDGTGFTILHTFTANSDGATPAAGLILSGNILYGTATGGGSSNYGTVFAVNTDGTGFTTLHHFTRGTDGANPVAGLILSGDILYGTAASGGGVWGTIFSVNTSGTGFTTLHRFTGGSDGGAPYRDLILSGNTLYGTAAASSDFLVRGTVYKVKTDGTGFSILHTFTATSPSAPYANSDGAYPQAGLILSGNTIYGTASLGGSSGSGTIFSLALPPPLSFADWAAGFGLSGVAAAVNADPDGDRLPNGAEYILGGDPTVPATSGRPTASISGGNMVFTFSRDDVSETSDVTLTVETGPDLVSWPAVHNIGSNSAASSPGVSIIENGTAPDSITVTIPQGTDTRRFVRMKATITP